MLGVGIQWTNLTTKLRRPRMVLSVRTSLRSVMPLKVRRNPPFWLFSPIVETEHLANKAFKDTVFKKEEDIQRNMKVSNSLSIVKYKFELPYLMKDFMAQVCSLQLFLTGCQKEYGKVIFQYNKLKYMLRNTSTPFFKQVLGEAEGMVVYVTFLMFHSDY